jgi:hypothetical protein
MTAIGRSVGSFRQANGRVRRVSPVPGRAGEGLLTEPTAATQPWRRQPLLMPLSGHSLSDPRRSQSGDEPIFKGEFLDVLTSRYKSAICIAAFSGVVTQ